MADGEVTAAEADYLRRWMENHDGKNLAYPFPQLLARIRHIYEDDIVDDDERAELAGMLQALLGQSKGALTKSTNVSESSESERATRLFFDDPPPAPLEFTQKLYCVTGTFAFGSRDNVEKKLIELGANLTPRPTTSTHFLLVGTFASDAWKHGKFGRKIETAIDFRTKGHAIHIIAEEHWIQFLPANS